MIMRKPRSTTLCAVHPCHGSRPDRIVTTHTSTICIDVLEREKVIVALENKREQFAQHADALRRQQTLVRQRLDAFAQRTSQEIIDYLTQAGIEWPGAIPTPELDQAADLCLPFSRRWETHQEARAWALDVLTDRPVAAVDGSQITPTKDINIPVGAVQVGWYINYHRTGGGDYVKDVEFDVLGPVELTSDNTSDSQGEDDNSDSMASNWRINQERFVREVERLCLLMAEFAADATPAAPERRGNDDGGEPAAPLCFFDGSFIVSFAGQLRPERALPYTRSVAKLLTCSAESRVPLAAFVDRSYSHDFVTLLNTLGGEEALTLSDAGLFERLLPEWGDRTPLFYCARPDGLSMDGRGDFYHDVAFTYMRLTADRAPARIELPRWLVEAGQAEAILDRVRAECVVGGGYPYAVETADALAVISQPDRQRFYRLFEQFVERNGLRLVQTRKAASKQARR